MLQSQLFTKTTKADPKDEESINAKLLIRAGFVRKEMAGVYSFLPLGFRVLKKIEAIIRQEMLAIGGQEVLMPALQPKKNWELTDRWNNYDVLFRFTSYYSKNEYVIGPTHEEIVTPLLGEFVSSYKDLPIAVFQIQNKFRDEKRAKSGVLRGREFIMKDMYSFHIDEKDNDKYYEIVRKAYGKIFKKTGLDAIYTFASGGVFSQYSHEFQVLTSAGEDTIYVCSACNIAVNEEIIKEQKVCPECKKKDFKKERAIEVGNIFKLKTRFSKDFNVEYKDTQGKGQKVIMGCYGIGLPRLMGSIVEVHNDEKGIIWPESVAPFGIHLLALLGGEKEAEKLYKQFQERSIEVLYDDRKEVSAGQKFADADLIGIPTRIIVSKKSVAENAAEIKKRNQSSSKLVKLSTL